MEKRQEARQRNVCLGEWQNDLPWTGTMYTGELASDPNEFVENGRKVTRGDERRRVLEKRRDAMIQLRDELRQDVDAAIESGDDMDTALESFRAMLSALRHSNDRIQELETLPATSDPSATGQQTYSQPGRDWVECSQESESE